MQLSWVPHRSSTVLDPFVSDTVVVRVDHGWALSVGAAVNVLVRCPSTMRSRVLGREAAWGPGTFE